MTSAHSAPNASFAKNSTETSSKLTKQIACIITPVHWHRWLGDKNDIRPVQRSRISSHQR